MRDRMREALKTYPTRFKRRALNVMEKAFTGIAT